MYDFHNSKFCEEQTMKSNKNFLGFFFLTLMSIDSFVYSADLENAQREYDERSSSYVRNALPNIAGFTALSLGAISSLDSLSAESSESVSICGGCINVVGAFINVYNWHKDRELIKGGLRKTFNGLIVLSNLTSAALSFACASSDTLHERNIFGVASLVAGASGLFFKGLDLYFTESPDDNKNKLESRISKAYQSDQGVVVNACETENDVLQDDKFQAVALSNN
jgi:hypothetical protein